MRLMKKDMGGAAHALALAQIIMDAKLNVRLDLWLPLVENAVSDKAFRPGDVIASRKGLNVEIDNTDAEGRLILADALARACEEAPALLIDFATLTGAARTALGPDLPPLYCNDEALAAEFALASQETCDPIWRMPLWDPYDGDMDSPIADLKNAGDGGYAGSIYAALFLRRFVTAPAWAHFDIFAWAPRKNRRVPPAAKRKPCAPAGACSREGMARVRCWTARLQTRCFHGRRHVVLNAQRSRSPRTPLDRRLPAGIRPPANFYYLNSVIPDARSAIRDPGDRRARCLRPLGSGFRCARPGMTEMFCESRSRLA